MMRLLGPDRPKALLSYSVLLLEEGLILALPAMIGLAIDRLLSGNLSGLLWLLAGIGALIASGAGRRWFDTRIFVRVQNRLSLAVLEPDRPAAQPDPAGTSRTAGRLRQIGEMIPFFEQHIPAGVSTLFASFGALAVLFLYDPTIAGIALAGALLLTGTTAFYASRTERLNRRINNRVEHEVQALLHHRTLARHLRVLGRLRIARSDAETGVFAVNWLIMLGIIAGSLLAMVAEQPSAGIIFAQMSYLLGFAEGMARWPLLVERWTHMNDVARRLHEAEP
jgi:ABC-type multidrug transport system fused ATPase/permease subunit